MVRECRSEHAQRTEDRHRIRIDARLGDVAGETEGEHFNARSRSAQKALIDGDIED
jgi:hypothetical protein